MRSPEPPSKLTAGHPSVGRLAQNVGISDQGVRNALKRMEALGALKIIRTKGGLKFAMCGGLLCSAANRRRFSAVTQLHRKGLSHATGPIQPSSFMAAARAAAPLGSASV
jgi:hypothetical protein